MCKLHHGHSRVNSLAWFWVWGLWGTRVSEVWKIVVDAEIQREEGCDRGQIDLWHGSSSNSDQNWLFGSDFPHRPSLSHVIDSDKVIIWFLRRKKCTIKGVTKDMTEESSTKTTTTTDERSIWQKAEGAFTGWADHQSKSRRFWWPDFFQKASKSVLWSMPGSGFKKYQMPPSESRW